MIDYITYKPTDDIEENRLTVEAIKTELIAIAENRAGTKDITYKFRFMGALPDGRVGIEIRARKRRNSSDDKRAENEKGR